VNAFGV